MTVKDRLHQLVDDLPEPEDIFRSEQLERLLEVVHQLEREVEMLKEEFQRRLPRTDASSFDNAPFDDEPVTDEERAAVAEAEAAIARGDVVRDEDLDSELRQ